MKHKYFLFVLALCLPVLLNAQTQKHAPSIKLPDAAGYLPERLGYEYQIYTAEFLRPKAALETKTSKVRGGIWVNAMFHSVERWDDDAIGMKLVDLNKNPFIVPKNDGALDVFDITNPQEQPIVPGGLMRVLSGKWVRNSSAEYNKLKIKFAANLERNVKDANPNVPDEWEGDCYDSKGKLIQSVATTLQEPKETSVKMVTTKMCLDENGLPAGNVNGYILPTSEVGFIIYFEAGIYDFHCGTQVIVPEFIGDIFLQGRSKKDGGWVKVLGLGRDIHSISCGATSRHLYEQSTQNCVKSIFVKEKMGVLVPVETYTEFRLAVNVAGKVAATSTTFQLPFPPVTPWEEIDEDAFLKGIPPAMPPNQMPSGSMPMP